MDRKGNEAGLVAAAAEGRSYAEIARVAGISVSTVKRRLAEPDVMRAIRDVRLQQRREHTAQLGALTSDSIGRLRELVSHDDPHVALRAVTLVLGCGPRFVTMVEFDERLHQLEQAGEPGASDE